MGRKAFVFDVARCSGCYCCQLACKDEHCGNDFTPIAAPQPDIGQFWVKVKDYVNGSAPKVTVHYVPEMCNHCEKCSLLAIAKDGDVYRVLDNATKPLLGGNTLCGDRLPAGQHLPGTGLPPWHLCWPFR